MEAYESGERVRFLGPHANRLREWHRPREPIVNRADDGGLASGERTVRTHMLEFLIAAGLIFFLCWVWVGGYLADFVVWLISKLTPDSSDETTLAYVVSGAALVLGIIVAVATSGKSGSYLGGAVAGAGAYVGVRLPGRIRNNRMPGGSPAIAVQPVAHQPAGPQPSVLRPVASQPVARDPAAGSRLAHITAIRMNPPAADGHEHIAEVLWQRPDVQISACSAQSVAEFIEQGNAVYAGSSFVNVGVIRGVPPYLRAYSEGRWTDDLLSLPRF